MQLFQSGAESARISHRIIKGEQPFKHVVRPVAQFVRYCRVLLRIMGVLITRQYGGLPRFCVMSPCFGLLASQA